MDGYRLYTVVPYLVKFIDQLTNIYVRYNRKRLKGKLGDEDTLTALCTLYTTLLTLCKVRSSPLPLSPSLARLLLLMNAVMALQSPAHLQAFAGFARFA